MRTNNYYIRMDDNNGHYSTRYLPESKEKGGHAAGTRGGEALEVGSDAEFLEAEASAGVNDPLGSATLEDDILNGVFWMGSFW